MKSFLLLQAVLLWTIASANTDETNTDDATTDEALDFQKMSEDTDFPGNDVDSRKAGDATYCQQLCSFHCYCTHFSYDEKSYDCYLKHVEPGVKVESTPKTGIESGYAIPPALMNDYQCYDHLFEEMDFPGHDILILQREDGEQCKEACTYYDDCEYFTFNTQRNLCYLKSSTMLPSPPTINIVTGLVSGYSLTDCEPHLLCDKDCSDLVLSGYEFPGQEFKRMYQPDPDRCQMICNDLPRCKFFTFIDEYHPDKDMRFTCSLKAFAADVPGDVISKPHHHSGFSLRTVRSHKSCSLETYDDLDFPGNDQRHVKTETFEDCRLECTDDPLCQFWTWVDKDFAQEDLHNNCYLKNVLALPTPPVIKHHEHAVSGFSQKKCTDEKDSEEEEDGDYESYEVSEESEEVKE